MTCLKARKTSLNLMQFSRRAKKRIFQMDDVAKAAGKMWIIWIGIGKRRGSAREFQECCSSLVERKDL